MWAWDAATQVFGSVALGVAFYGGLILILALLSPTARNRRKARRERAALRKAWRA